MPALPKKPSQSGRRLYLLTPEELRLDMGGRFRRWVLATGRYAGEIPISREIPAGGEAGACEIIEGSWERKRFDLWFSGKVLSGEWELVKDGPRWRFTRRSRA